MFSSIQEQLVSRQKSYVSLIIGDRMWSLKTSTESFGQEFWLKCVSMYFIYSLVSGNIETLTVLHTQHRM